MCVYVYLDVFVRKQTLMDVHLIANVALLALPREELDDERPRVDDDK